MTDPDPTSGEPDARRHQGIPRWVIGFIIAGVALVVLVVVLLALGHSPRQHTSSPTGRPTFAASPAGWS